MLANAEQQVVREGSLPLFISRKTGIIIRYLIVDLLLLTGIFLIIMWALPATFRIYLPKYIIPFTIFITLWIVTGLVTAKYRPANGTSYAKKLVFVTNSNVLIIILSMVIFRFLAMDNLSYRVLLAVVGGTYILEVFVLTLLYAFKRSVVIEFQEGMALTKNQVYKLKPASHFDLATQARIEQVILEESGRNVLMFLKDHVDLGSTGTFLHSANHTLHSCEQVGEICQAMVDLRRINDKIRINKYFEGINAKLPYGGLLVGCVETKELRKQRLLKRIPFPFNYVYYSFDYVLTRMAPKMFLTKSLYFYYTEGHNRVISRPETFGRLYSCGFELIGEQIVGNRLYFAARKQSDPFFPKDPTYGSIIRLKRVGQGGDTIYVYKLRTMHPYSEYLQDHIYKRNHLQEGGKLNGDFRVTTLGRWLRKLWIDELPMIVNWLRGDLKLVGVRPISRHYFSLYTPELQQERIKHKPGLLPPHYAHMPKTLEEIMATEWTYLKAYEKAPFRTDWVYFWRILRNIVFNGARSK